MSRADHSPITTHPHKREDTAMSTKIGVVGPGLRRAHPHRRARRQGLHGVRRRRLAGGAGRALARPAAHLRARRRGRLRRPRRQARHPRRRPTLPRGHRRRGGDLRVDAGRRASTRRPNLANLAAAARAGRRRACRPDTLVVVRSTVPVGTSRRVVLPELRPPGASGSRLVMAPGAHHPGPGAARAGRAAAGGRRPRRRRASPPAIEFFGGLAQQRRPGVRRWRPPSW